MYFAEHPARVRVARCGARAARAARLHEHRQNAEAHVAPRRALQSRQSLTA